MQLNIGQVIKEKRISLGMTQKELAQKVGYKNATSITRIENERDLPIYKLQPIAKALNIDIRELFGWSDKEEEMEDRLLTYFRQLSDSNKELIIKTVEAMRKK